MLKPEESELLSAFLDKELTGDELVDVQNKLTNSAEWREELQNLKMAKSLSSGLPRLRAPVALLDSIEEMALAKTQTRRFGFFSLPRYPGLFNPWAMVGTFATAVVLVAVVQFNSAKQNEAIPLEALLAAHSRTQSTHLHENVLSTSEYSHQMKNHAQS